MNTLHKWRIRETTPNGRNRIMYVLAKTNKEAERIATSVFGEGCFCVINLRMN